MQHLNYLHQLFKRARLFISGRTFKLIGDIKSIPAF